MKILIAGAGSVGTLIGGKLAYAGENDVVLYNRHQEYCEAVRSGGILVREKGREFHANARAYPELSQLFLKEESVSLAILAVRSFSTRSLLLSLVPYLHRIGHFLTVGNGVTNEELLLDYVNPAKITAAALTTASSMKKPGIAEAENKGGIGLAPIVPGALPAWVPRLFRKSRFSVTVCSDWKSLKWSKLLLNIMANATCAILDMSMSEIYDNPRTFHVEKELALEALRVMRAHRIRVVALPGQPLPLYLLAVRYFPEWLLKKAILGKAKEGRGKKLSSLHLDFQQGKRETEWPYLYGALLEKAVQKRVSVPTLRTLCRVLEGITSGKIPWEKFKRNPKALSDEILETVRRTSA